MKEQEEKVIRKLKENGYRITQQRRILLDILFGETCASCKEIYYRAAARDKTIGMATVYRMINILEEIGAISRENMYKIDASGLRQEKVYQIMLDDNTKLELSADEWERVIRQGLKACGYLGMQEICSIKEKTINEEISQ